MGVYEPARPLKLLYLRSGLLHKTALIHLMHFVGPFGPKQSGQSQPCDGQARREVDRTVDRQPAGQPL
jgi:hypothetical protein